MKILNKVVIGMASLCLLTACGPSKVSYDKFHEKAVEAVKNAPAYVKFTAKGTLKASSLSLTLDDVFEKKDGEWTLTKGDALDALVASMFAGMTADTVTNDEGTTYYAGGGFKATKDDNLAEWNSSGYITHYKADGSDVKFSWSK